MDLTLLNENNDRICKPNILINGTIENIVMGRADNIYSNLINLFKEGVFQNMII